MPRTMRAAGATTVTAEPETELARRQAVARRLWSIIEEKCGTLSALKTDYPGLGSTVKNWVPQDEQWRTDPQNTAALRRVKWENVRIPGGRALIAFCICFKARPDYILLGLGAPYQDRSRTNQKLEADLETRILGELPRDLSDFAEFGAVNAQALIAEAATSTAREIRAWQDWHVAMLKHIVDGAVRVEALYSRTRLRPRGGRRSAEGLVDEVSTHNELVAANTLPEVQLAYWLLREVRDTMKYFRPEGAEPRVPDSRYVTLTRLRTPARASKPPLEVEFTTARNPRDAPQIVEWLVRVALEQLSSGGADARMRHRRVKAVPFAGLRHLPDSDQPAILKEWLKRYSAFWHLDGMDPLPIEPGRTRRPQAPRRKRSLA